MAAEPISSLTSRWETPVGRELAREILHRLSRQHHLNDLGLNEVDGRLDLRGFSLPEPKAKRRWWKSLGAAYTQLSRPHELKRLNLDHIDLSGARLRALIISDSAVSDCLFDSATLTGLRLWRVRLTRTGFHNADLRAAVLGPLDAGQRNLFQHVELVGADMRSAVVEAACFVDCDFSHARLDGIDFDSSHFVRCRFAGRLGNVIFWGYTDENSKRDPNPMEDVDFTEADLAWVEFRRLDLDSVSLPTTPSHIQLTPLGGVLDCVIARTRLDSSQRAKRLRALAEHLLRWRGAHQHVAIVHWDELGESEEDRRWAAGLLRECMT